MAEPKTRKKWYARPTFLLALIAGWMITIPLADAFGFWVWFVLIAVLVATDARNPGTKAKPTDLPTTPAPAMPRSRP
jgi:hypothetical protein